MCQRKARYPIVHYNSLFLCTFSVFHCGSLYIFFPCCTLLIYCTTSFSLLHVAMFSFCILLLFLFNSSHDVIFSCCAFISYYFQRCTQEPEKHLRWRALQQWFLAVKYCCKALHLRCCWWSWLRLYHCLKSVRIRRYSGPHFPAFGLNTERYSVSPYSVRMQKNVDHNNSEYGHFSRSVLFACFTFLYVAIFSCCTFLILKNIENEWRQKTQPKKRPYTQRLELISLSLWYLNTFSLLCSFEWLIKWKWTNVLFCWKRICLPRLETTKTRMRFNFISSRHKILSVSCRYFNYDIENKWPGLQLY